MVIKLPRRTFSISDLPEISHYGAEVTWNLSTSTAHCDCPDPNCAATSVEGPNVSFGRGSGLCYLYADSYNSTLRLHTEVGNPRDPSSPQRLQCLGQGGSNPAS